MSNPQTYITSRKNARYSGRGGCVLSCLIPAALFAGVVLLIGVIAAPPRYVARASFSVDWNAMPSVPNDEIAAKVRNVWRKLTIAYVSSLPDSRQELSDVLNDAEGFKDSPADRANLISTLQRHLHMTLASQAKDRDLFIIEVQGNDPKTMQMEADMVLHGITARLKTQAANGDLLAVARSGSNGDEISQKVANLQVEEQKIEETYSQPFPDAVQERYDQLQDELNKLQLGRGEAGLSFLSNLTRLTLSRPIKIVKAVQVEKQSASFSLSIFVAMMISGGIGGAFGLLLYLVVRSVTTSKVVAGNLPPVINARTPTNSVPPVLAEIQAAKPPILPYPLIPSR